MRIVNLGAVVVLLGVLISGCASGPAGQGPAHDVSTRGSMGMAGGGSSPAVEELDQYVLVIQETPGGHLTHSWRPIAEFDLSQFRFQPRAERSYGRIVLAAAHARDCHAELDACIDNCLSQPLSEDYSHITSYRAKSAHCRKGCWQPYRDCEELQRRRPQEFSATNQAIDWLKRNRDGLLVGSTVVIAGVAFVVAFPPGVLIVLIPAAALASSEFDGEPRFTAVAQ
ncbi:MAG TPA: hypothetical protein VFZ09_23060 [Archangium sp.]|uniref:hypothetical protein n=1 Tax=Archangium sp. TaxID=1872627 RepID=UPI002E331EB1|nr:hypothetical protein [Archangium sp.]HEX5749141.1 hypothetical protein [Archangium sp.]